MRVSLSLSLSLSLTTKKFLPRRITVETFGRNGSRLTIRNFSFYEDGGVYRSDKTDGVYVQKYEPAAQLSISESKIIACIFPQSQLWLNYHVN